MKNILLASVFAFTSSGFANELDNPRAVTSDQIKLSEELPQTVVIRTLRGQPGKVEVVHLKHKLPAGEKLKNLKFEQMALNAEIPGLAYDSSNELELRSSTSSWMFGLGLLGLGAGLIAGSAYSNRAHAGGSYSNNYYGNSYYGGNSNYNSSSYYPASSYAPYYRYSGYNYGYSPYYRYSSGAYDYSYCNWQQAALYPNSGH